MKTHTLPTKYRSALATLDATLTLARDIYFAAEEDAEAAAGAASKARADRAEARVVYHVALDVALAAYRAEARVVYRADAADATALARAATNKD